VVTAVRSGAAIIRAASEGRTGDGTVTVVPAPVATVAATLTPTSLAPGETAQASAVARDAGGNVLTGRYVAWTSLSPNVASVSISGVVTGITIGTAVIRATIESKTADASVVVASTIAPVAVASVTASVASGNLVSGQSTQATAVARDAAGKILTGRAVAWTCLTPEVASVSSSGVVTAIAPGTATIRATVETKTGDASLVATAPAPVPYTADVSVVLDSANLAPGHSAMAHAVVKDQQGNVLTGKTPSWQSTNASIATISATGQLTAVSTGTASIQATVDGVLGQASLAVTAAEAPPPPPDPLLPPPIPSPGHPNEPAGFAQLSPTLSGDIQPPTAQQYVAGSANEIGWINNNGGVTKVTDLSSPSGSTNVLEIGFPAGFIGGVSPSGVYTMSSTNPQNWPQHPKALYQSYWYKVSPNFPANLNANKMVYSNIGGGNKVYTNFGGGVDYRLVNGVVEFAPGQATAYTTPLFMSVDIQGVVQVDGTFQPSFNLRQNVGPSDPTQWKQLVRGQWHHIETLYVANSAGTRDGTVKLWIDGTLTIDFTNRIQWSATADMWQWTTWLPVYGGGGMVPTNAVNAYHRLKDFYVSGK